MLQRQQLRTKRPLEENHECSSDKRRRITSDDSEDIEAFLDEFFAEEEALLKRSHPPPMNVCPRLEPHQLQSQPILLHSPPQQQQHTFVHNNHHHQNNDPSNSSLVSVPSSRIYHDREKIMDLQRRLDQAREEKKNLEEQLSKYERDEVVKRACDEDVEQNQFGVLIATGTNRIVYMNDLMLEKLGWSKDQVQSLHVTYEDVLHPSCVAMIMHWCVNNIVSKKTGCGYENVILKRKGIATTRKESEVVAKRVVLQYMYEESETGKFDKVASESRYYF